MFPFQLTELGGQGVILPVRWGLRWFTKLLRLTKDELSGDSWTGWDRRAAECRGDVGGRRPELRDGLVTPDGAGVWG